MRGQHALLIKRFYKLAHSEPDPLLPSRLLLKLDGRVIKTPCQHPFWLPTAGLSFAVAHEFNSQKEYLNPGLMQLGLTRTAVDVDHDPALRSVIIEQIMGYLPTDTLLFRLDPSTPLGSRQQEQWQPLLQAFLKAYPDAKLSLSFTFDVPQQHVGESFRRYLQSLNAFELVSFQTVTSNIKSAIGAWSILARREEGDWTGLVVERTLMEESVEVEQAIMRRNETVLLVRAASLINGLSRPG